MTIIFAGQSNPYHQTSKQNKDKKEGGIEGAGS